MEANLLKAGSENREQKEIINKTFCRFFVLYSIILRLRIVIYVRIFMEK